MGPGARLPVPSVPVRSRCVSQGTRPTSMCRQRPGPTGARGKPLARTWVGSARCPSCSEKVQVPASPVCSWWPPSHGRHGPGWTWPAPRLGGRPSGRGSAAGQVPGPASLRRHHKAAEGGRRGAPAGLPPPRAAGLRRAGAMAEGGELMSRLVSENADLKRQVRLLKENQMLKRLLSESCPERGRGAREPPLPRAPAYPEDGSPGAAGEARRPAPPSARAPPRQAWRPPRNTAGRPGTRAGGRIRRRRARRRCRRGPWVAQALALSPSRRPSVPASGACRVPLTHRGAGPRARRPPGALPGAVGGLGGSVEPHPARLQRLAGQRALLGRSRERASRCGAWPGGAGSGGTRAP